MTRVKICGITRAEDAECAVEAGAHALGFVFYAKSPRNVALKTAAGICAALPPLVARIGVFVNATEGVIEKAVAECGLDTLQFHGDEPPGFCRKFSAKTIKAFRLRQIEDLLPMAAYDVDAWLLDAHSEDARGGTGKTFDWRLATEAKKKGRPIILSGGLTPDNVAEAIRQVAPYGVDVSSGVEKAPGIKDHARIRAFLQACREAA
ncbi:MAG: phosphoribosylanthranilate isomerase [Verrucomicrobia bacterium]|nr:phosphoribosylanthranilate isomerase [Verrucomicrobiota bacterium]